jgi:hypothetical protein
MEPENDNTVPLWVGITWVVIEQFSIAAVVYFLLFAPFIK